MTEDHASRQSGSVPSSLGAGLRRHDRDRFQTALFAPAGRREALFALYAFNFEVARIPEVTREPLLGRIRLQWWREAIAEIYAGAPPRRHEVVKGLAQAIRDHALSLAHFDALLDARELDWREEAPETLHALESYAAGSSGSLVQLVLEALDARDEPTAAAGRAVGIAYALSGLLVAVPFHARMRRLYLPQELIAGEGLDVARTLFELKPAPALGAIARTIAAAARRHLDTARRLQPQTMRRALPALMLAIPAAQRLKLLQRVEYNLFDSRLARQDPRQSWRLAWAALRQRY